MVQQRFGDLHLFAEAVKANPVTPDIRAYLETLDLTDAELEEALERFNLFCKAILDAGKSRLSEIAAGSV